MAAPSGVYNLIRSAVTTSTAITIQQVLAPAGTMIEPVRAWAEQSTITTSAQTRIQLLKKTAVATVTSATPAVLGNAMQASKCVGGAAATGITATVEGTDGAVIIEEGFNIVNGWLYLPVPEERTYAINQAIALKFPTAPTSAGYSSGISWLEYAG
jgi:hypothetical protein